MKSTEKSLSDGLRLSSLDENMGPVALVRQVADVFHASGGGSMVDVYTAPRVVSWSKGRDIVDSEWIIALGIAALVAAVLGIAVMIVLSVCQFCGTLGSYSACFWTMLTWSWGYWC